MQINKRPNESSEALMRRFFREVQQSRLLTEIKEQHYRVKPISRYKMRQSALRRAKRLEVKRGY